MTDLEPTAATEHLPSWTDAASITSYLTSAVTGVVAVITLAHPGFTEPALVRALIPAVSLVIAGGAQIFNAVTHRTATARVHVALIAANAARRQS